MELHRDFKELLESFNAHGVEYVLVGAYALAFHGAPLPDRVVQLGVPPVRVDLVTSLTGVSWDEVWSARIDMSADGIRIAVINRAAFVKNKRATGRPKDLIDAGLIDTDEGTPRPD